MRALIVIALVAIAFGAGYFTHARLSDEGPERVERSASNLAAQRTGIIATLTENERETTLKRNFPELIRKRYEAYEKSLLRQAEMDRKMMSAMLKPKSRQ